MEQWLTRRNLRRLIANASLLGAAAFLAALFHQFVIFFGWGLNFAQIATVGDVILGGLYLICFACPLVAGSAVAFLTIKHLPRPGLLAFSALLLVVFVVAAINAPALSPAQLMFWFGFLPGALGVLLIQMTERKRLPPWMLLIAPVITAVIYWTSFVSSQGYWPKEMRVETPIASCPTGELLWSGERSIVVWCADRALVLNDEGRPPYVSAQRSKNPSIQP